MNIFKKLFGKKQETTIANSRNIDEKTSHQLKQEEKVITPPPKKKELVEYIKTDRTKGAGYPPIEFVIEEYKAPNKSIAMEFLKTKTVTRPYHMITVETPEVKVVKDKDGIFERKPRR